MLLIKKTCIVFVDSSGKLVSTTGEADIDIITEPTFDCIHDYKEPGWDFRYYSLSIPKC